MVVLYHRKEIIVMAEIVRTMKLMLHTDAEADAVFGELTARYALACNRISEYIFDNGFILNFMKVQEVMYQEIRNDFGLKAQMTISAFKTVTARYKTVKEQLYSSPYKYKGEDDKWHYITRSLEWLQKPVRFSRPQADLVRGRDYSFSGNQDILSLNTLSHRVKVSFERPACFRDYFDGTWSFGTGKLVSLKGHWYFHIPMTKKISDSNSDVRPVHVVGIDRGLRFITTTYDETGRTTFVNGANVLSRREQFIKTRAELQARGTKSAKRALKRISGRENRWISDVNHRISKTLVGAYGEGTLFVLEDLSGVSFAEQNLNGSKKRNRETRSWTFYQLEQYLSYKAMESGSMVIKVPAEYTSQRCPKCGRIHKENRHHEIHEYICDSCGYRSNDDRIGAMNLYILGTMYVSGDTNPRFGSRRID